MDVLRPSSVPSFNINNMMITNYNTRLTKHMFLNFQSSKTSHRKLSPKKSKLFMSAMSPTPITSTPESIDYLPPESDDLAETESKEIFHWYSQWYPVMFVCDLDKRKPLAKKVLGLDIVVWWDRNESAWKVFHDSCPHRLAPLSEGRIDQSGRLQCSYHGWCFDGSGNCKVIPQASRDGPPVQTFKKACVGVYPTVVHHDIVWFWPNTDPLLATNELPYIPELYDPSYFTQTTHNDVNCGFEVLIDNIMDPAHLAYAHYGLVPTVKPKDKVDHEGGRPLDMRVEKLNKNGFIGDVEGQKVKFLAPGIFALYSEHGSASSPGTEISSLKQPMKFATIFLCVPVSPGKSRLLVIYARNFSQWVAPRWFFHLGQNLIIDSDLIIVHVQEQRIKEVGPTNWQKAFFLPTKSDAFIVGSRKWLNNYAGGQVDWKGKFTGDLPPSPPREQVMDRYQSHVANCRSCSSAYKRLQVLEIALQVTSILSAGIVVCTYPNLMSPAARLAIVSTAVLCFLASRYLGYFIYKSFRYHDYDHAFRGQRNLVTFLTELFSYSHSI